MHADGYKPLVSIIVPVYGQAAKTAKCFQSIRSSTVMPYEIIWVDNGSDPHSFDIIKRQATKPRMHTKVVKFKQNQGFVKAINAGLREVEDSSEFIIFLNNDTEVTRKWASKLTAPLKDKSVGAVGPVTQSLISWQEPTHLNLRWNLGLPKYPIGRGLHDAAQSYAAMLHQSAFVDRFKDIGRIPLSFFCAAFRKEVIEELGPLDEDFGMGLGDDDEYCYRLRAHGYRLMLSLGTFVFHWHRTTFTSLKLPIDKIRRHNIATLKRKKEEYDLKIKKGYVKTRIEHNSTGS